MAYHIRRAETEIGLAFEELNYIQRALEAANEEYHQDSSDVIDLLELLAEIEARADAVFEKIFHTRNLDKNVRSKYRQKKKRFKSRVLELECGLRDLWMQIDEEDSIGEEMSPESAASSAVELTLIEYSTNNSNNSPLGGVEPPRFIENSTTTEDSSVNQSLDGDSGESIIQPAANDSLPVDPGGTDIPGHNSAPEVITKGTSGNHSNNFLGAQGLCEEELDVSSSSTTTKDDAAAALVKLLLEKKALQVKRRTSWEEQLIVDTNSNSTPCPDWVGILDDEDDEDFEVNSAALQPVEGIPVDNNQSMIEMNSLQHANEEVRPTENTTEAMEHSVQSPEQASEAAAVPTGHTNQLTGGLESVLTGHTERRIGNSAQDFKLEQQFLDWDAVWEQQQPAFIRRDQEFTRQVPCWEAGAFSPGVNSATQQRLSRDKPSHMKINPSIHWYTARLDKLLDPGQARAPVQLSSAIPLVHKEEPSLLISIFLGREYLYEDKSGSYWEQEATKIAKLWPSITTMGSYGKYSASSMATEESRSIGSRTWVKLEQQYGTNNGFVFDPGSIHRHLEFLDKPAGPWQDIQLEGRLPIKSIMQITTLTTELTAQGTNGNSPEKSPVILRIMRTIQISDYQPYHQGQILRNWTFQPSGLGMKMAAESYLKINSVFITNPEVDSSHSAKIEVQLRKFQRLVHGLASIPVGEWPRDNLLQQLKLAEKDEEITRVMKTSNINNLAPILDAGGILRVGGRLENSNREFASKNPAILPYGQLAKIYLRDLHARSLHAGPTLLLATARQQVWPIRGPQLAREVVKKCIECTRWKGATLHQQMGHLPSTRTEGHRAFHVTGVDYAGPVLVKTRKGRGGTTVKTWISVFVCFASKAIHLELVSELTSEAFIAALRRFVARRGLPQELHSDNGTNFVGADKELKILLTEQKNQQQIVNACLQQGIDWKFIPPSAPHQGGLWEAAVKSVKRHLRRVLGDARLTYEEFNTVLCQVEAQVNSRPLSPLTEDSSDLEFLTPGHFLIGKALTAAPDPSLVHIKENRLSRLQYLQRLQQGFWEKWSLEYLSTMQKRFKWKYPQVDMKLGTLVIIKEDNVAPTQLRRGRVINLHTGKDGKTRVVTLRTSTGEITRPIVKLIQLG